MNAEIVFDIHTYWHAGTGRGDGARADAIVQRSPAGLPYLPGRTVKGLLREAMELAEEAGAVQKGRASVLFGTNLLGRDAKSDHTDDREKRLEEARFRTEAGTLRFSSATLGERWERWIAQNHALGEHLFTTIASTRIDADGLADDQTLRSIEVTVPMSLRARIEAGNAEDLEDVRRSLLFVRAIGAHRNRGLGRVTVRLEEAR